MIVQGGARQYFSILVAAALLGADRQGDSRGTVWRCCCLRAYNQCGARRGTE